MRHIRGRLREQQGGARHAPYPTLNRRKETSMIGIVIAVLFAALVYAICLAVGLPAIVGIVAAILVLLAGIPSGGYGLGGRFGSRY
jgi:ABC-type phosphate transport system permease subunit